MDVKLAEIILKFVTRVCNKHRGLRIEKYSKLSGEVIYRLESCDCG